MNHNTKNHFIVTLLFTYEEEMREQDRLYEQGFITDLARTMGKNEITQKTAELLQTL